MYARVQRGGTGTDVLGAHEGSLLRRLAATDELVVSLWDKQEQAAGDATAEWYEVEHDHAGTEPGATPAVAMMVSFDGPLNDDLLTAARRADKRNAAAMAGQSGLVRVLVLWQPERRSRCVVVYATSVESIESAQGSVMSTRLGPDEDPALLPGPDRVDLFRVRALPSAKPVSYRVLAEQSTAAFVATSLFGMAKVPGTIGVRSGAVSIADGQTLVTAELAAGTIATGNARRDKDLRSRRFLDVDAEPTLRFDGKLVGEHTLHGTLRRGEHRTEIDLTVEVDGMTVLATGTVERMTLGVGPKSGFIGRTVRIQLTVVLLAE